MKKLTVVVSTMVIFFCLSPFLSAQTGQHPFKFRDAAHEVGILPEALRIHGHGAAWGDVDGNGWIDLYIGTFSKDGKQNLLFRNNGGTFKLDKQQALNIPSRTTGVLFADLDNDGDPDLYIGSMPQESNGLKGNSLFENVGKGIFKDISRDNGACPVLFGGRSATVLDYDGDGLLDILAGEDPLPGYNGSPTKSSRLFRNKGQLQFEDVSRSVGLPADIPGYGVAAGDINSDGWPDFFIAANNGGNLLFLNDKKGRFYEAPGTRELFAWKGSGGDNMVCGVSLGDVNRDGLPDIVMSSHFDKPWITPQPLRLFMNKGKNNGNSQFEEVTTAVGLKPLPMKAPHVEIQDFDNDGYLDIYTSVVKFKSGNIYPVVFKNTGITNHRALFREDVLFMNDFPTDEDKTFKGKTATFFEKMLREKKIMYTASGPTGDYDNDGRLDIFLPSWWPEAPSLLLHNETSAGNWLNVRVDGAKNVNRMGVGCRVKIYRRGEIGDASAMIGCGEISVGYGYASGQPAIVHFGLGKETIVDVEVILPHGKGKLLRKEVKANQMITFP
jgi:hypothetical protein